MISMMNKSAVWEKLTRFGLTDKQIQVYLALLGKGSVTPLELSRQTNINRSTAYRILDSLVKLGLVEELIDQKTSLFTAQSPAKLHVLLTQREAEIDTLKATLPTLIQDLSVTSDIGSSSQTKVVYFRDRSGLQQLLWNTLQAKGEVVGYGYLDWNECLGKKFAEKLRVEYIQKPLKSREIVNSEAMGPLKNFTDHAEAYSKVYQMRGIQRSKLIINHDTYIYDSVFAFSHFIKGELFGVEIHNAEIAHTQKQMFDLLWNIAKPQ